MFKDFIATVKGSINHVRHEKFKSKIMKQHKRGLKFNITCNKINMHKFTI